MSAPPLVSVVMPAYKARYLPQALESVRRQNHRPLELVICDDSRDGRIEALVKAFAAKVDFPVHYSRNPSRLWEMGSTARAIGIASGDYIKFLHDDDVLHDGCIAALLQAFIQVPDIALAASRRCLVGEAGELLPDTRFSAFPLHRDLKMDGRDLIDYFAEHTTNFIGEPSAVMCRRAPLLEMVEGLPVLGGVHITWIADLALYVKLLRHGALAMLHEPQVDFRVSREQFSQFGRDRPGIGTPAHETFKERLRALGWQRPGRDVAMIGVVPLHALDETEQIDLPQALAQAHAQRIAHWVRHDWRTRRQLDLHQRQHVAARLGETSKSLRLGILLQSSDTAATDMTLSSLSSAETGGTNLSIKVLAAEAATTAHDGAALLAMAVHDWDVDWFLIVQAGSMFDETGLLRLLVELGGAGEQRAFYADEWYQDNEGRLIPTLRPDINLDLLLGNPATMAGHWIFRREAVVAAGGFDPAHAGAMEFELILRLIHQGGLAGIGHLPEPLLTCPPPRIDVGAQQRAILTHLHARGFTQAAVEHIGDGQFRIDYAHERKPLVSIVVIAPQALATLERCVVSLLDQTRYANYELLLIDNGAPDDVGRWIQQVESLAGGRVRAFSLTPPLARSAACNVAAGQASGEFVVFLRADVAIVQPQWLDELLNHGQRPEVGIVGARTVSADGTITHAGLVPGLLEGGGRAFAGSPIDARGYMGRLQVAQNYSAVSDSCLLVRMELLCELGGFDDTAFDDAGADVDLCLRASELGYLTVWTPQATLLHAIEPSALPAPAQEALFERWLPQIAHDPAYNRNLAFDAPAGFVLGHSELSWDPLPWRPLPRVLASQSDASGSGHYRIVQPFDALKDAGLIDGARCAWLPDVVDVSRFDPDVLVVQRRMMAPALETMGRLKRHSAAFKVYELDDYVLRLPATSVHHREVPANAEEVLRDALRCMDRFVVSTPRLAEMLAGHHPDIRVCENRLDPKLWRTLPTSRRRAGSKPRVGWAGGVGHAGDLEMIADVVRMLADDVSWVFFGMCPDRLRPYVEEFRPGVPIDRYPQLLAGLNLDVALAPLEQHIFNECKSNLRLLEYGACGYPVVCTDIAPYRGDLPVTRVRNRTYDWVDAIRMHLADPVASAAAGDALRDAVRRDWMLEGGNLELWRQAWLPG